MSLPAQAITTAARAQREEKQNIMWNRGLYLSHNVMEEDKVKRVQWKEAARDVNMNKDYEEEDVFWGF